jgi:hypothetical protein
MSTLVANSIIEKIGKVKISRTVGRAKMYVAEK